MKLSDKASTGMQGFDDAIDMLRLGDNVVWQVDAIEDYIQVVEPYIKQAKQDQRNLIYVRFGRHRPIVPEDARIKTVTLDASRGFETFATAVHQLIEREGKKAFYVFDCLTDLLEEWHSDLMIGNFFKVSCPFLYELDTIAYFAIIRNAHTYGTIAGIRETTQLLLDLYRVDGQTYIHPLKVMNRYSPTMFFPHLIRGQEAFSITASAEAAALFSTIRRGEVRLDHWDVMFQQARETLTKSPEVQMRVKRRLMSMLIGKDSRMFELCDRYFTLQDILMIAAREVGTGFIGGKSVGMLLARKIIERDGGERFARYMEPHDSFYLGADVFYTYIVQNGWWKLRTKQKTKEGYFAYAEELKANLLKGKFPENIREKFLQVLEYFGQSPIIVRSSSLLEDNFGNAFAGKYESVFLANQGTPEDRYAAFEQAIREVYASMMNEDALHYRMDRGLWDQDEQMAILVQRVSGDHYGEDFFPHLAGVGNSSNLYVWDDSIDMNAGMLRVVFGLGTRAVDRTVGDYARLVFLDQPLKRPQMNMDDYKKFSQHEADVISLRENALVTRDAVGLLARGVKADRRLFASVDHAVVDRYRERGITNYQTPYIIDFHHLLQDTDFPALMREMLSLLSKAYEYPVDIEFTANITQDGRLHISLLQCRPLQTRGLGKPVEMPEPTEHCFFSSKGNFMGGNVRLRIDYTVFVKAETYLRRSLQDQYAVARLIGKINEALKEHSAMLVGPGRWGTTTPSLGVPVHFTELSHMSVLCEVASANTGMMPELSYGSHFFQDIVESGIFYVALFNGGADVEFHPEHIASRENLLTTIVPGSDAFADVIHIAKTDGMEIFSDIVTQRVICQ